MGKWRVGRIVDVTEFASIAGEGLHFVDQPLWETYVERIGLENCRGIWEGERYVGGLAFYRMGQWYGGNLVGCAGVSGVSIDPSDRGSGACKTLLVDLLTELHAERMPLASLYASTQRLYRSVGFEQSGQSQTFNLPMSSIDLPDSARELEVARTETPDLEQLSELARIRAKFSNGNIERTNGLWQRVLKPIGHSTTTYLIRNEGKLEGYAVLMHGRRAEGYPQALVASDWVATTPKSLQRLATLARDHRSMNDSFQWKGGPQDQLLLAANEQRLRVVGTERTLNRIVCFKEAIEARGYPKAIDVTLELQVGDPLFDDNAGNWLVQIKDGHATANKGGRGQLKVAISDLVPLYTSLNTAEQLKQVGRLESADSQQLEWLQLAFSGPSPWTSEMF